jgi:uncharacterized protein
VDKLVVVLDTNIYISAFFWRGIPFKIFHKALTGDFTYCISQEILDEIKAILKREFDLNFKDIEAYSQVILATSYFITPIERINLIKDDPTDNKFIECAVASKADFIVSGDNHLLRLKEYKGIKILSAREFIEGILA